MADAPLIITRDEQTRTATLTLNRPDKRNALNAALVGEMTQALRSLATDAAIRVLIVRGNGKAFCAGADLESLKALQTATREQNIADSEALRDMLLALYSFPKPTIAQVHGPALAGGAGIASCCDFVLASSDASLGYPEVKIGFVAAMVMVLLTRQVGERRARDLLLSGRALSAQEAASIGLVTRVVEPAALEAEVQALAASLTQNSPQAMSHTKELLASAWSGEVADNMARAARENAQARATADCQEGIAAFLEKRRPGWFSSPRPRKAQD